MKKRPIVPAAVLSLLLLFSGCSKSNAASAGPTAATKTTTQFSDGRASVSADANTAETGTGTNTADRKVVITASFTVETDQFTDSSEALLKAVTAGGGYLESLDQSGTESSAASGTYVLRVPVKALDEFTSALGQIGNITNHTQSSQDITDTYYDAAARLEAKKAQRDRLIALMEKAGSLSDLLQIEKELTSVQGDIDALSGQQQRYDNQVEYATVTVRLHQKSLAGNMSTPFGRQIAEAFEDSFAYALGAAKGLGIVLIWMLPYLLLIALVIGIILFANRKKRRARREEKEDAARAAKDVPQIILHQREKEDPGNPKQ